MPLIENPQSPLVARLEGLHLFHFDGAPCAQRVRFALGEKGLSRGRNIRFGTDNSVANRAAAGTWTSRIVSLVRKDHMTPEYAAIQPNMVVPALVHDGRLYIESMDIIAYLDEAFGGAPLVPRDGDIRADADALTARAKALHVSVRYVTFHWGLGRLGKLNATEETQLRKLAAKGADDENLVAFYEGFDNNSFADEVYFEHLRRLHDGFIELDQRFQDGRSFLTGEQLTMADIIWAMKIPRLIECGYPISRYHPAVYEWFRTIAARPSFKREVMGNNRTLHHAFRAKAAVENLFGKGLAQAVSQVAA